MTAEFTTDAASSENQTAEAQCAGAEIDSRIVIEPNRSLGARGAWGLFGTMFAVQVLIVGGFAALVGTWMILPFAGLELAALAGALYLAMRSNRYREVVTIDARSVSVEKGYGKPEQRWQVPVAWAQVRLCADGPRTARRRLLLRAAGTECEVGRCLPEHERIALAQRLRSILGRCALT